MKIYKNLALIFALFLANCAASPLKFYTLTPTQNNLTPETINFTDKSATLYIYPVTLPDYLESSDIITKQGSLIISSPNARLTSVLSKEINNFVTNNLAIYFPHVLVTNQNLVDKNSYRLMVNFNQFDVEKLPNKQGRLICKATWYIFPSDKSAKILKYQTQFVEPTSLTSDEDIIKLQQITLNKLTQSIAKTLNPLLSQPFFIPNN